MAGIIYAPNGTVTIHSKNLSFNGVIVAEEVKIATNKIEMVNTNADIYEKLAQRCYQIYGN